MNFIVHVPFAFTSAGRAFAAIMFDHEKSTFCHHRVNAVDGITFETCIGLNVIKNSTCTDHSTDGWTCEQTVLFDLKAVKSTCHMETVAVVKMN